MMPACTGPTGIWCRLSPSTGRKTNGAVHGAASGCGAKRLHHVPGAVVEPGPRVGQADRLEAEEVADRALEPDRRRMDGADRGKALQPAVEADDADPAGLLVEQRHVDGALLRPQAEQRPAAGGEIARDVAPGRFIDQRARPRAVRVRLSCGIASIRFAMRYPRTLATFWNQATSGGGR